MFAGTFGNFGNVQFPGEVHPDVWLAGFRDDSARPDRVSGWIVPLGGATHRRR